METIITIIIALAATVVGIKMVASLFVSLKEEPGYLNKIIVFIVIAIFLIILFSLGEEIGRQTF